MKIQLVIVVERLKLTDMDGCVFDKLKVAEVQKYISLMLHAS
jgi:hypothetical protein